MKLPIVAVFVVLGSLAATGCGSDKQAVKPDVAAATPDVAAPTPIRPYSNCLDADHLNNWFVASSSTLYASDSNNYFRINMDGVCPRMGKTGSIRFQSATHTGSDTRICGDDTDRLFTDAGISCSIGSVVSISATDFDDAQQKAIANQ